jgi:hypothetical protein
MTYPTRNIVIYTYIFFDIQFIFELVHKKNPLTISTQDDMEELNKSLTIECFMCIIKIIEYFILFLARTWIASQLFLNPTDTFAMIPPLSPLHWWCELSKISLKSLGMVKRAWFWFYIYIYILVLYIYISFKIN